MKKVDLESREYDVNLQEEDMRFVYARREMIAIQVIVFAQILIGAFLAYGLTGTGESIGGYPSWYVYGTILYLVVAAFSSYFALKVIRRSKLDARADNEVED